MKVEHKIRQAIIGELMVMKNGYSAEFTFGTVKRLQFNRFALIDGETTILEGTAQNIIDFAPRIEKMLTKPKSL